MKRPAVKFLLFLALISPALATDVVKRVKFDSGSSGTVISGTLDPSKKKDRFGTGQDRYILGAGKGQTMDISIQASGSVMLYVWHKDYNKGFICTSSGTSINQSCKLPANADYNVDVSSEGGAVKYKMTVEIH